MRCGKNANIASFLRIVLLFINSSTFRLSLSFGSQGKSWYFAEPDPFHPLSLCEYDGCGFGRENRVGLISLQNIIFTYQYRALSI
jgi:hypothetical protein